MRKKSIKKTNTSKISFSGNSCDKCLYKNKQKDQKWTWAYKKIFSDCESVKNSSLDGISFSKEDVKSFSQLIFSWNSDRPKKGGYFFYIQTRNARSKKWSGWHKMFYWGYQYQQSYSSTNKSSEYVHVRLETGLNSLSDAFKIVIEGYNGANLGLIKSVCACVSDLNKFKPENVDYELLNLKSVYIKGVPKISQRLINHADSLRICSPTSCSMLAGYLNKYPVDTLDLVDNVYDPSLGKTGSYGNWCFNVAEMYCKCRGKVLFYVTRMNTFKDLYKKLLEGLPVIVSVRGKLDGATIPYKGGHLLAVVGWDADRKSVICNDPAFYTNESTLVKYKLKTFLRGWENSNRLAYVANINI